MYRFQKHFQKIHKCNEINKSSISHISAHLVEKVKDLVAALHQIDQDEDTAEGAALRAHPQRAKAMVNEEILHHHHHLVDVVKAHHHHPHLMKASPPNHSVSLVLLTAELVFR